MNQIRVFAYGISLVCLLWGSLLGIEPKRAEANKNPLGDLNLVVNGEDFVREGFVSKDGWTIKFDHLYINLVQAIAYASRPPFEPQPGDTPDNIRYQSQIELTPNDSVIDLTKDINPPMTVAKEQVPADFYNALVWHLDTAPEHSPMAGQTMVLQGQASKNQTTVEFEIKLNQPVQYVCGAYVGERRLGFVTADAPGYVEATLHFDHLFGSAELPPQDHLNLKALGFAPFAALAVNNRVDLSEPASQLSPQDYQELQELVLNLGHVGEGHCVVTN